MSAFISYSRTNSSFAVRLAKDLKSAGYDIWLDQLDIPTGARWDDEIEIALEACTTFMIVLSPESIQSQNVKDEIGFAIDSGKDVLPVRIKSGDIPLRLRRFQYVDFTNRPYEESLKKIKSLLSSTGQLLATKDADKKLSRAETQPAAEQTQPLKPKAISFPAGRTRMSRRLMAGMAAVGALVIAGIIIGAIRISKPPAVVPPTGALVVENSPTERPTAEPTADLTQIAALRQPGPSRGVYHEIR